MDDKLQPYLNSIKTATFDGKFQEVMAWSQRVERAEKAREQQSWNAYSKPMQLPRLRTVLVSAFVMLAIGIIPFEREHIAGRLILMAVDGNKEDAKQLMRKHQFPSSNLVYTQEPIKDKSLIIFLMQGVDNAQANTWRRSIERDPEIELRKSIEFKDKEKQSLLGEWLEKDKEGESHLSYFAAKVAEQRKFYDLAAPYVKEWFDGGRFDYTLSSNYQYDGSIRFSAVPNGFPPMRSDLDKILMVNNLAGMIVMSLEGEEPSIIQAKGMMNSFRDSIEVLVSNLTSEKAIADDD